MGLTTSPRRLAVVLLVTGIALVTAGIAIVSVPLALVVLGTALAAVAIQDLVS